MKIITATQTRQLDTATIQNEPISSLDLMERASQVFTDWFVDQFPDNDIPVHIFCGPGNNGGDGLVVARLLYYRFYEVSIYLCEIGPKSEDNVANLIRLPKRSNIDPISISPEDAFPDVPTNAIIIDAIFGSGLNREVTGYWADLIQHLNKNDNKIVSIDIPSGLFADQHTEGQSIEADYTFIFELPKLAFCFPQNNHRVGDWTFKSIGLDQKTLANLDTCNYFVDADYVKKLLHKRSRFDHKGTYGHALLIVGSYGKVGAAVLATKACLRSGVGLVSVYAPACAYEILQTSTPEAMVISDEDSKIITGIPPLDNYKSIGIGCGLSTDTAASKTLPQLLQSSPLPLVIDADALNIIAAQKSLLEKIPKGSILTPHPKEFERLFGKTDNDFHRNEVQKKFAKDLGLYIILKGAHTCIATPDGNCFFNSTGNPGMATGGSGDVLTGIITGLMAQQYTAEEAAIIGVYLHGFAGDLAVEAQSEEAMVAGDIVSCLGKAFENHK